MESVLMRGWGSDGAVGKQEAGGARELGLAVDEEHSLRGNLVARL